MSCQRGLHGTQYMDYGVEDSIVIQSVAESAYRVSAAPKRAADRKSVRKSIHIESAPRPTQQNLLLSKNRRKRRTLARLEADLKVGEENKWTACALRTAEGRRRL